MVPMVKAPKTEGMVRLTVMQLKQNPKKEKSTIVSTITSLKEDNGSKKFLPQCTKKALRGNNVVMRRKPSRCLSPMKEVDREGELEEINK